MGNDSTTANLADLATNIWSVPAYLPYVQPPLTDEMVHSTEAAIGQRLPPAYVSLLKQQNGGYIRLRLPESCHKMIYGIGPRFPNLALPDWSEEAERTSFPLDGLVPFDGDGHWHICLDYRDDVASPKITHIDIECDIERPVAPDFENYLKLLAPEVDEGQFVIYSSEGIEAFAQRLARILKVEFQDMGSYAHGYPSFSAQLGVIRRYPQWIGVCSNSVPRGFVRSDDPDFESLKAGMTGKAKLYPELPESCLIMNVSEQSREKTAATLKINGIEVTALRACLKKREG